MWNASHTPSHMSSMFQASDSLMPILVFDELPCLWLEYSILLKSPTRIQLASGIFVCAKWFHNIAPGPLWLNPYKFRIPSWSWGLSWRVTYWALLGYSTPWELMEVAILSDSMIHVPPLNLAVRAEKIPSFHKPVPFLNSKNLACLMLVALGILFSCSSRMSVVGVVCLKRYFICLRFHLPVKPWPKPRVSWVAMVILSPSFGLRWILGG